MSCNNVQILNFNHNIVEVGSDNKLIITDNVKCNSVTIPQPVTNILQINSPGPQGPAGLNANTGSFVTTSSFNAYTGSTTSQFAGTASYATTSSFSFTASYALNAGTTFNTSSFVTTLSFNAFTASYNTGSFTGSFIGSLQGTASWAISASQAISSSYASFSISSSYASASTSASYAESSSYALSASYSSTASFLPVNTYNITSSWAQSSSNAINAQTASAILGGKATHIPFYNTDITLATSSIYQSGSTSVIINLDVNTTLNPEALFVWQPSQTSFNVISGKGNLNNYLQLNIQNGNAGPTASSDVVATANNGNEIINYIDMGINNSNFIGDLGEANDAYLYSTGRHLHIGNASNYPVQFFAGGFDTEADRKFELNPNGNHNMTGSLEIDTDLTVLGGITGSLYGTASWAENAITASYVAGANVVGTVTSASHAIQADNAATADFASIAGNGGVTNIVAGAGITLIPTSGVGAVTVISSGGGGVTIISGSNVTQSFNNSTTWTFTHNLQTRVPVISVFDTNYNQIIPQNIELTDTASATITFPIAVSGFAVASLGGTTGTVLSSSYSLFSTYADTASVYIETDPIFVAKSASLATTGSNIFRGNQTITGSLNITGSINLVGNQTITGSLTVSGSNTFTKIGPSIFSGSVTLVNGATGSLLGTASYADNANLLDGKDSTIFATTGSNIFKGNQTITGSLLVTQSYISTVDYIDFTTTSTPTHLEGRIHWDTDTKTLQIDTDVNNFAIPAGHTSVLRGKNENNFTLTKGTVVYINGEQGNTPTFATASWDNEIDSAYAIAVIAQDINTNNNGYAVTNGILTGINTNAYAPSTLLYLSSSGQYTSVKPIAPNQGVRLGQVITQATNGSIYVKVDNGYEIGELHDVIDTTTTSSFGDLLVKSGSVWINSKSLTGSYSITGSLTISGSSTFTNIGPAKFTGSVDISGSVNMAGDIVPIASSSFSLGSATNPWKEIFLKSGSISIESDTPGGPPTVISNIGGNILLSAGGMQLLGSGSFNASTGSFGYISGSLTQVGDYTRIGNTILTGSFNTSGSITQIGNNTVTGSITATAGFTGSLSGTASWANNAQTASYINSLNQNVTITGSLRVSGSLTEIGAAIFSGSVTLSSGSALNLNDGIYLNGHKQFNYAQFANTSSILVTANVSASFTYPLTYFSDGVSVSNNSRITFAHTGVYNLSFSTTVVQGAGTRNLNMWFRKTGSNIDNSNTLITLPNSTQLVLSRNFAYPFSAGEYVELWYHSDGTNTSFNDGVAIGGFPATPSIIVTVTQIA